LESENTSMDVAPIPILDAGIYYIHISRPAWLECAVVNELFDLSHGRRDVSFPQSYACKGKYLPLMGANKLFTHVE
jgi:hypothetical protein